VLSVFAGIKADWLGDKAMTMKLPRRRFLHLAAAAAALSAMSRIARA
jgi:hypothetical protein